MMDKKKMTDDDWITATESEEAFTETGPAFPGTDAAKMDDILEQALLVKDFVTRQSENGKFAIMLVRAKKAQNDWSVACGGKLVMEWLKYAKENNYLPLIAVFVREKSKTHRGYSYYVPMSTKKYREWNQGRV